MLVLGKEGEKEAKKLVSDLHLSCRIAKNKKVIIAPLSQQTFLIGNDGGYSDDYKQSPFSRDYVHRMFENPESLYNTDRSMAKADAANLDGILQKIFSEADNHGKRTTVLDVMGDPNLVNLPHENIIVELSVWSYDKLVYNLERRGGCFGRDVREVYKALRRCA